MKNAKMYKKLKPKDTMMIDEPVIAYGLNYLVDDIEVISLDTMHCLVTSALNDFRINRCTSHNEMDEWINNRMGWK